MGLSLVVLKMNKSFKSYLKSFFVDFLLFSALFGLGYSLKSFLTDFFAQVSTYQTQIQTLEPGLANQSTEALYALDPLVGDFHTTVLKAFIIALIVLPFIVYFLFVLSNSFLLAHKHTWSYYWKSFVLGLPLLFFVYLFMDKFFEAFGNFLYSSNAFFAFVAYVLLFSLLSYSWYTLVGIIPRKSLKDWKLLYKKFFPLYFVFLLFFLVYLFLLFFLVYFVVSVFVGSFFGNDLWFYFALFIGLLIVLEGCRLWYSSLLQKYF